MNITTQILQTVVPVLVMIAIGYICNSKKVITEEGLHGLKNIIGTVMLPVVLFNAFFTVKYTKTLFVVFVVVYASCGLALLIGYLLKRYVAPYDKFYPFLMTSFEAGMLGYSLFGLLMGSAALSTFAIVDIGQTLFAYTIFLVTLKSVNGEKVTAKGIVFTMLKSPACIGVFLGVILGILGIHGQISDTSFGVVLAELIQFISAPTAALILIVLGYELSIKKEILKPVLLTVVTRILVMAALLGVSSLIIFSIIPFDKSLFIALMILFSLPAPFVIPLFADVKGHGDYISTTLSLGTLTTVLLYIGITVYAMI